MKARIREPEYEMSYEYYKDHCIRYVNVDGHWWAVLDDVCKALKLRTDGVSYRIPADMMMNVPIKKEVKYNIGKPNNFVRTEYRKMTVINPKGILFAFGRSNKLEARQFQMWNLEVLDKLRINMGISERETFRMLDREVQEEINYMLDEIYWDEEKKCIMRSVTVQGGDVEQVQFI